MEINSGDIIYKLTLIKNTFSSICYLTETVASKFYIATTIKYYIKQKAKAREALSCEIKI